MCAICSALHCFFFPKSPKKVLVVKATSYISNMVSADLATKVERPFERKFKQQHWESNRDLWDLMNEPTWIYLGLGDFDA